MSIYCLINWTVEYRINVAEALEEIRTIHLNNNIRQIPTHDWTIHPQSQTS